MGIRSSYNRATYFAKAAESRPGWVKSGEPYPNQYDVWYGDKGIISGGETPTQTNVIQYTMISAGPTTNATDFGDLTVARGAPSSASNGVRMIVAGGNSPSPVGFNDTMEYITIATSGNGKDFGDLTENITQISGTGDGIYGIYGGGNKISGENFSNIINRSSVETLGNAIDFGDLTEARIAPGCCGNGHRAVWAGGYNNTSPANKNIMDYVVIQTAANAGDFGDLNYSAYNVVGTGAVTRGLFMAGRSATASTWYNTIDYITIAATGNATDFGDLTQSRTGPGGASSTTRGVFAGGSQNPGSVPGGYGLNVIDYVTIDTTGDATDFGDLPASRYGCFTASSGPSGEKMYIFGGDDGDEHDDIYQLNIATTGNASSMGRMDVSGNQGEKSLGACAADASRVVIAGGRCKTSTDGNRTDQIEYLAYGSAGNTSDFGDLRSPVYFCTGTSSGDSLGRMIVGGGDAGGTVRSYIDYFAIQTTGNASDFGDMLSSKQRASALSGDAA
mgnify:CR=1 FL=1